LQGAEAGTKRAYKEMAEADDDTDHGTPTPGSQASDDFNMAALLTKQSHASAYKRPAVCVRHSKALGRSEM
jgi:hypothetical protein